MLEKCDGILVLLTLLKIKNRFDLSRLNRLNSMLENRWEKLPVVIAFNRFNADLAVANELLSSDETGEMVSNNYPASITNFGKSFEKTSGSDESPVRIEGGFETLDCLLGLMDKVSKKHTAFS